MKIYYNNNEMPNGKNLRNAMLMLVGFSSSKNAIFNLEFSRFCQIKKVTNLLVLISRVYNSEILNPKTMAGKKTNSELNYHLKSIKDIINQWHIL